MKITNLINCLIRLSEDSKTDSADQAKLLESIKYMSESYDVLRKINAWKMPETGDFWDSERTRPVSYATQYGSQGEQRVIRNYAYEVLKKVQV